MRSSMYVDNDGQAGDSAIANNREDLKKRAKNAQEVATNASLKSSIKAPEKVENKNETSVFDTLLSAEGSKFKKNSKERKVYSLNLNLYQKAALFTVAKSDGCAMKEALNRFSLSQIIKKAETLGLDERLVKELFDKKLIK